MNAVRAVITVALVVMIGLYAYEAIFSMVRFGGIQWIHLPILVVLVAVAIFWFLTNGRPHTAHPGARNAGDEDGTG